MYFESVIGIQSEPVYETIAYYSGIIYGHLSDAGTDGSGCRKINVL